MPITIKTTGPARERAARGLGTVTGLDIFNLVRGLLGIGWGAWRRRRRLTRTWHAHDNSLILVAARGRAVPKQQHNPENEE